MNYELFMNYELWPMKLLKPMRAYHSLLICLPVSIVKHCLCMMSWGISQVCAHRAYETCETHAGLSLFTNISTCESSEVLFMYDVLGDISSMHSYAL